MVKLGSGRDSMGLTSALLTTGIGPSHPMNSVISCWAQPASAVMRMTAQMALVARELLAVRYFSPLIEEISR